MWQLQEYRDAAAPRGETISPSFLKTTHAIETPHAATEQQLAQIAVWVEREQLTDLQVTTIWRSTQKQKPLRPVLAQASLLGLTRNRGEKCRISRTASTPDINTDILINRILSSQTLWSLCQSLVPTPDFSASPSPNIIESLLSVRFRKHTLVLPEFFSSHTPSAYLSPRLPLQIKSSFPSSSSSKAASWILPVYTSAACLLYE